MEHDDIEKRVEEAFYYQDGTFKPLGDNWGNTNPDVAHLRDTYMEAEKQYFVALLSQEKNRSHFEKILSFSDEELFYEAEKLRERLENGDLETEQDKEAMANMTPEERDKYHMQLLEWAEGNLCLMLAAIRDKEYILELSLSRGGRRR